MAEVLYHTPTLASGSVEGITEYHYGAMQCIRGKIYPIRVRSDAHTTVMAIVAKLSMLWESALNNADRAGWGLYAAGTPIADPYGNPRYIPGYAHYIRSNRPRLQYGLVAINTPPSTDGLPTFHAVQVDLGSSNDSIWVGIDLTDAWATDPSSVMYLWCSDLVPPQHITPSEVYAPLGTIQGQAGNTTQWYEFATLKVLPDAPIAICVRASVQDGQGRLSEGAS